MRLGEAGRVDRDGSAYDHRVDVQAALAAVSLIAAHVGRDLRRLDDVLTPAPGRGPAANVDFVIPLGDP